MNTRAKRREHARRSRAAKLGWERRRRAREEAERIAEHPRRRLRTPLYADAIEHGLRALHAPRTAEAPDDAFPVGERPWSPEFLAAYARLEAWVSEREAARAARAPLSSFPAEQLVSTPAVQPCTSSQGESEQHCSSSQGGK